MNELPTWPATYFPLASRGLLVFWYFFPETGRIEGRHGSTDHPRCSFLLNTRTARGRPREKSAILLMGRRVGALLSDMHDAAANRDVDGRRPLADAQLGEDVPHV